MKTDLKGKTIVITGASSGIGKAIALTLAKENVNLILAARREALLQDLASECESLGSRAMAVRADVTLYPHMENLLNEAIAFFGGVDVWINNAGVGAVGKFDEVPLEIHESVIKTDLIAYLYGAYAVLPYFKDKKKGMIINMISLGGFIPDPFAVGYSASKFGLRGFSGALRGELVEYPEIKVCDVCPAFIDTPGFSHAANYLGKKLKPLPPVFDPFKVALKVKKVIERPRSNIMVGYSAYAARFFHGIAPDFVVRTFSRLILNYTKRAEPTAITEGNINKPVFEGTGAHGDMIKKDQPLWKYQMMKKYFLH
ncbi:MAG: SDR family oxidoreductase [Bdellovibrionota bacterium]